MLLVSKQVPSSTNTYHNVTIRSPSKKAATIPPGLLDVLPSFDRCQYLPAVIRRGLVQIAFFCKLVMYVGPHVSIQFRLDREGKATPEQPLGLRSCRAHQLNKHVSSSEEAALKSIGRYSTHRNSLTTMKSNLNSARELPFASSCRLNEWPRSIEHCRRAINLRHSLSRFGIMLLRIAPLTQMAPELGYRVRRTRTKPNAKKARVAGSGVTFIVSGSDPVPSLNPANPVPISYSP